ncbi:hypothetical protein ABC977_17085 [Thioalkalicoccus limnaeus]|uniref:Restriction endonuclease domain-containing protein n=1 Tax=Thioalkalicoccus limnaeus TaxID=120681 RepID=A0ABV4BHX2_9GAMM
MIHRPGWLVDLIGRRLSIHRRAAGHCYADVASPEDLTDVPLPLETGGKITTDLTDLFWSA